MTTVMGAVPAVAVLVAGMLTVIWLLVTDAGVSEVPLKFTVAPELKPVPLSVNVNAEPPGATEDGTSG